MGDKTCIKISYVMQNSENKPLHTQKFQTLIFTSIDVRSKSVNHNLVNIWSIAMKFCYQTGLVTWCNKSRLSTTKQSFVRGVVVERRNCQILPAQFPGLYCSSHVAQLQNHMGLFTIILSLELSFQSSPHYAPRATNKQTGYC